MSSANLKLKAELIKRFGSQVEARGLGGNPGAHVNSSEPCRPYSSEQNIKPVSAKEEITKILANEKIYE